MEKVSAIICAYNEEKTIKNVITAVCNYSFDEVIIINDASEDRTGSIIRELKQKYIINDIHLPENNGKGRAMAVGVEESQSEILVFCDADLSNLNEKHFEQLIIPIMKNEADMVLGQPTHTLFNYKLNPFKSFTGERSLRKKDILPILDSIKTSKFGVETLINLYYQAYEKKIKYVLLNGLKHPTKFEKTSQSQAIIELMREGYQIAGTTLNNLELINKVVINQFKNFRE